MKSSTISRRYRVKAMTFRRMAQRAFYAFEARHFHSMADFCELHAEIFDKSPRNTQDQATNQPQPRKDDKI